VNLYTRLAKKPDLFERW